MAQRTFCPYCGSTERPMRNEEHRVDEPRWQQRNPLKCVSCGGVGDHADFGLLTEEQYQDLLTEIEAADDDGR